MEDFAAKCFVCEMGITPNNSSLNKQVNLPVCNECKGTQQEKKKINELLEGLAEGFVCGCI
jgi:hypothetical protein